MAFSRFLRTLLRSWRSSNCIFADTSLSVSSQNNTNTPTAHIGSRRIFDGYTDCALFRLSIPENYSFPFKKTTLHVTCKTNIGLLLLHLSTGSHMLFHSVAKLHDGIASNQNMLADKGLRVFTCGGCFAVSGKTFFD